MNSFNIDTSYQFKCCQIKILDELFQRIVFDIVACRFRYFNDNGMLTQLVSQADSCDVILRGCCLVNLSPPGTPDHHVVQNQPAVRANFIHWWLHKTSSAESGMVCRPYHRGK